MLRRGARDRHRRRSRRTPEPVSPAPGTRLACSKRRARDERRTRAGRRFDVQRTLKLSDAFAHAEETDAARFGVLRVEALAVVFDDEDQRDSFGSFVLGWLKPGVLYTRFEQTISAELGARALAGAFGCVEYVPSAPEFEGRLQAATAGTFDDLIELRTALRRTGCVDMVSAQPDGVAREASPDCLECSNVHRSGFQGMAARPIDSGSWQKLPFDRRR